jgi:eukaryotic-like serine/threonine-protein kinase
MRNGTVRPAEEPAAGSRSAPWWLVAVSASFASLWALLFYCDFFRIQSPGMELESDGARIVVAEVAEGTPAGASGLRPGDLVERVNGRPVASRLDLIAARANLEPDRPLHLTLSRDGTEVAATIPLSRVSWRQGLTRESAALTATRLVQLATLVIAMFIAFRRPRDAGALAAAWLLGTVAVASITLPYHFAAVWRVLPLPLGALIFVGFLNLAAIGAAIFTFFALFPRPTLRPRTLATALAPMLLVAGWQASFGWRLVWGAETAGPIEPVLPLVLLANIAYAASGFGLAARGYRRLNDVTERRRLRVVLSGSLVACLAGFWMFVHYWTSEGADYSRRVMSGPAMMAGTLLFLALPASFAYAILRHRLFDVTVIVRRGLQYALARRLLALLVPGLVTLAVLDLYLVHDSLSATARSHAGVYALAAVVLGLTYLRRDRWLEALDRRFFRERYDAQRLLGEITADVRRFASADPGGAGAPPAQAAEAAALMARVLAKIQQALHPETAAVLVRRSPGEAFEPLAPAGAVLPRLAHDSKVASVARVLQKPVETPVSGLNAISRELPPAEREALRDARIEVLVPVVTAPDRLDMLLALGPKRSEEPYSAEDLELLATIADSLAFALDRAGPLARAAALDYTTLCLAGRYRLDRQLGEGGMGTVYAATDLALEREVAIKLVREDLVASAAARDRFYRETRIVAGFTHPHIVTVHDCGVAPDGRAFIVMERLRGATLAERLGRGGALPPARALAILRDVCAAVDVAHARGFVHRDLKPANIFLARDDGGERAKVLDFGVAKLLARDAQGSAETWAGALVGTPRYMAPEQLRGEPVSAAWDVWALAMVAFEMLAGQSAFEGADPSRPGALAAARPEWRPFFDDALAFDPARRPPSALALVDGLARALGGARSTVGG